jgi:hypothetical protein
MPFPGVFRSLPSCVSKVTVPYALLELGRLLVQLGGAEMSCKFTRLGSLSAFPRSRHLVKFVHHGPTRSEVAV